MPTIACNNEIEFVVECGVCGASLTADVTEATYRTETVVKVEVCDACLEKAKEEADTEGYDRGKEDGRSEGFEEGKAAALKVIEDSGQPRL